jgi:hypothetical protein
VSEACLPASECPACGYVVDAATCITEPGARPSAGDISVCLDCAALLVFGGDDLQVRLMTKAEEAAFALEHPKPYRFAMLGQDATRALRRRGLNPTAVKGKQTR